MTDDRATRTPPSGQPSEAALALRGMVTGFFVSRALYIAAELDIAGKLAKGVRSVEERATDTTTHAPTLYRLLRALASNGVFRELDDRRFENTELSELLREDVEGSQRGITLLLGDETSWRSWEQLGKERRVGPGPVISLTRALPSISPAA